jgi:4-amino-4-deoxy-L-arabinose transferase-like glycosyltransferase
VETTIRESPVTLAILVVLVLAGLGLRVGYAVEQPATPPPDARAYERIAANLERDGSFDTRPEGVGREVQPSSAYSPGLPLFVAAVYWVSGGVHLTLALVLLALIGTGAIPMTYLLGRRFAGPVAGLIGAGLLAFYPALLEYQGLLLTEPLAAFLLSAGLVLYLKAASAPLPGRARESDMDGPSLPRPRMPWAWFGSGAVFGLLALVRPEYLLLALGLPFVWLAREVLFSAHRLKQAAAPVASCLLATALVLAPWAIHNAVELHRFVPISTGGGKALFIGTNLEADGDAVKLRELLLAERPALRQQLSAGGPVDDPGRMVLERVLDRVAAKAYPDLETDAALGRLGRQNLEDDVTEEPLRFAGMLASKSYDTWTDAARGVMLEQPWRALQLAIVVLGLAGLAILAHRRRFEALVAGLVLLYMTGIAALLIASPRRELVVLPLLTALSGAALAVGRDSLARRWAG